MALPARLSRYNALLHLLAEQLAREILAERDSPADGAEFHDSSGAADGCVERVARLGSGDDAK
jgi:hypothetical protein